MKYFITLLITLLTFASTANSQNTTETKSEEPILDFYDVEPQFPGGPDAMIQFIQTNVVYPEYSREHDEQGTVYVQFVVNLDGSISEVNVLKGVSSSLDAEAVRLIKSMPNWIPGEQAGRQVRTRYVIPIKFMIDAGTANDDSKKKKKRK